MHHELAVQACELVVVGLVGVILTVSALTSTGISAPVTSPNALCCRTLNNEAASPECVVMDTTSAASLAKILSSAILDL